MSVLCRSLADANPATFNFPVACGDLTRIGRLPRAAGDFKAVENGAEVLSGGFILLARELFEHPLWNGMTPGQRCVLVAVIEMANWKDGRMWLRSTKRMLPVPRGSFVASQQRIAERANVDRKVVRGALDNMEASGFLCRSLVGQSRGQRLTLITINNYAQYQSFEHYDGPRVGPSMARSTPHSRPLGRPPIESSEHSERKEPSVGSVLTLEPTPSSAKPKPKKPASNGARAKTPAGPPRSSPAWAIAGACADALERAGCWKRTPSFTVSGLPAWADVLHKLHRIDGETWDRIREVCEWFPGDRREPEGNRGWTGWADKVTPGTLRDTDRNARSKFDKVAGAMDRDQARPSGYDIPPEMFPEEWK